MITEQIVTCRLKSYIQPFEKALALRELAQLADGTLIPGPPEGFDFTVRTSTAPRILAERLAYWEHVHSDRAFVTTQVLREATVSIARNGVPFANIGKVLPFKDEPPLPNRRCLRYGPHGIHEYRGKFFPQLVRALLNGAGVRAGGVVADTMCGSGTTPVEAALLGCTGIALDLNPLSVFISRTKCDILHADPESLAKAYNVVRGRLSERSRSKVTLRWFASFTEHDQAYVKAWFSPASLRGLERIVQAIRSVKNESERALLWVCLSNILRRVSWQKEDDLRVRREEKETVDPIREFLDEMTRTVRSVLTFLFQNGIASAAKGHVFEGDARDPRPLVRWKGKVDAVVTSPPYATSLPYLDTDRLSLIYLKLLPRCDHRRRDLLMVGNREITDRTRRDYWDRFLAHKGTMAPSIVRLIDHIESANAKADVGFRRKNLGALLAKYFVDMASVFDGLQTVLKPKAPAFVVIGSNHTYAGGERVEIDTATLLGELAASRGFTLEESIPMEMLVSRDIFRKNASAAETILMLRRRQ